MALSATCSGEEAKAGLLSAPSPPVSSQTQPELMTKNSKRQRGHHPHSGWGWGATSGTRSEVESLSHWSQALTHGGQSGQQA